MTRKTDLTHFLQLRVSKETIEHIDDVIAAMPDVAGLNRCRLIRYALQYALASISAEPNLRLTKEQ